jgi:hypothetical protein
MAIEELIQLIRTEADKVDFDTVINTIAEYYHYTPGRFTNGSENNHIVNQAGKNEGSCKIFYFAKLNQLSKEETLACFGKYYRDDVLKHPDKEDHGNIRSFMVHGWDGIHFDQLILMIK